MPRRPTRSALTRFYVGAIVLAGSGVLALVATRAGGDVGTGADLPLVLLAIAVLLGELLPIRGGPEQGEVPPSTAFTWAILIGYGVPLALLVQAFASIVADARSRQAGG